MNLWILFRRFFSSLVEGACAYKCVNSTSHQDCPVEFVIVVSCSYYNGQMLCVCSYLASLPVVSGMIWAQTLGFKPYI